MPEETYRKVIIASLVAILMVLVIYILINIRDLILYRNTDIVLYFDDNTTIFTCHYGDIPAGAAHPNGLEIQFTIREGIQEKILAEILATAGLSKNDYNLSEKLVPNEYHILYISPTFQPIEYPVKDMKPLPPPLFTDELKNIINMVGLADKILEEPSRYAYDTINIWFTRTLSEKQKNTLDKYLNDLKNRGQIEQFNWRVNSPDLEASLELLRQDIDIDALITHLSKEEDIFTCVSRSYDDFSNMGPPVYIPSN